MTSPFLRNRSRQLAQQSAVAANATALRAPAEDTPAGQEYAVLRVSLHEDLRKLSDTESVEARRPMKAKMAGRYAAWIEGVLEADAPTQDEILVTNMIWAIDYRDFPRALRLAEFVIKHGLALPERYNRNTACLIAEEFAEAALTDADQVDHQLLLQVAYLTGGADMPDQARAKLMKAIGLGWADKADAFDASDDSAPAGGKASYIEAALTALRAALALDKKVGVKKRIEQLERQARTETGGTETEQDKEPEKVAPKPTPKPPVKTARRRKAKKG